MEAAPPLSDALECWRAAGDWGYFCARAAVMRSAGESAIP